MKDDLHLLGVSCTTLRVMRKSQREEPNDFLMSCNVLASQLGLKCLQLSITWLCVILVIFFFTGNL